MQLIFESVVEVASGSLPNTIQFPDTSAQIFSITGGDMFGRHVQKLEGYFDSPVVESPIDISPDENISSLEIRALDGFGLVGDYKSGDTHKLIIYEFLHDIGKFIESGNINMSIDSPISSFTLSLKNIREEGVDPLVSEHSALLSPGSKLIFKFGMGEDEVEYDMGTFFADRVNYSLLNPTISVDGRNLIGKTLKDQTLNENHQIPYDIFSNNMKYLFETCNLSPEQYNIKYDTNYRRYDFSPDTQAFSAAQDMLRSMIDWKMEEIVSGEIIVGPPDYDLFPTRSMYTFYRDKDIFSRDISMDDQESYRKVCVHDQNWTIKVYAEVQSYSGWNLNSNKTLFIKVAEGTSLTDATAIANSVATRLENVGKVESFDGPFRPYLLVGDGATIVDSTGSKSLGLITELSHSFGESGFTTNITVDSGGALGQGRLSDYIKKIERSDKTGSIGYEDLPEGV